jgi:hypothetical protein
MDEMIWHKCRNPFLPRRTIDGGWTLGAGQVWKRKVNGKWEYQQDEETMDEFLDRQW